MIVTFNCVIPHRLYIEWSGFVNHSTLQTRSGPWHQRAPKEKMASRPSSTVDGGQLMWPEDVHSPDGKASPPLVPEMFPGHPSYTSISCTSIRNLRVPMMDCDVASVSPFSGHLVNPSRSARFFSWNDSCWLLRRNSTSIICIRS